MTIRTQLMKLALHLFCLASNGTDIAADAASAVASALAGGQHVDMAWIRAWKDSVPLDCPCRSHAGRPLAPACAND